jgi:hypothetical protein
MPKFFFHCSILFRFALCILLFCFVPFMESHAQTQWIPLQREVLPRLAQAKKVDYLREVHPLLQEKCGGCHLNGKNKGGLRLDTRAAILQGGVSGPAAIVGDAQKSLLIQLVEGHDPDRIMPPAGPKLTPGEVEILRSWINGGLSFEGAAASAYRPVLAPRTVKLPPGTGNAIDRILTPYFKQNAVKSGAIVSDRVYARRVYLDLIGLLPPTNELQAFLNDKAPDKRAKLVQSLLMREDDYATHWLSFWNDALRNDYAGTGYIDGGRQQITTWLYEALKTNRPYDQFTRELVNPTPASEGFIKGIIWRGTVNASQVPPMQAAQNISQVFLGINLKCASCHDSFTSDWKLSDAYGLAGIYADKPLEMVRCDVPLGKVAPTKFLYAELGEIDGNAPRQERLKQLARALTSRQNGRFARTIVNRVWARLMGAGLVEPTDEMDRRPWNEDLLDYLADDFANNSYDLKKLMANIVTSRAYQIPSAPGGERLENFVFTGPQVKRLSAEQFADAIFTLTGEWPSAPAAPIGGAAQSVSAKWIWNTPQAATSIGGGHISLRKSFTLPELPALAAATMSCDNEFILWINGKKAASGANWQEPTALNLKPFLKKGQNTLAVQAINWPDAALKKGLQIQGNSPSGFIFDSLLRFEKTPELRIGSDASWLASAEAPAGWEKPEFVSNGWQNAVELFEANGGPWKLDGALGASLGRQIYDRPIRAALLKADTLMVALGRPNREVAVTARPSLATTLQALELTNGRTLAGLLQQGAKRALDESNDPKIIANTLWQRALGRAPNEKELAEAQKLIGNPATSEGVEDALWALTMLPEFQLVY